MPSMLDVSPPTSSHAVPVVRLHAEEQAMTEDIVIGGDSADIPDGTYPATLTEVSLKESAAYGQFRAWDFTLDSGSVVGGATSLNTGAKSKGGRWIAALLGRKPVKGETVKVIGGRCLVVVLEDDRGWPKVTDVLPPMAQTTTEALDEATGHVPVAAGQSDLPF